MRIDIILKDTLTLCVHQTQIVLRTRIPLFRTFAIPLHRFLIVLRDALTFMVHRTQIALRNRIPLFR